MTAAILLSGIALFPLTDDRAYLGMLAALTLGSTAIGALAARLRVPEPLVRVLLLLPGILLIAWNWEGLPGLLAETAAHAAESFAPMAPHDGFRLLSAVVLWLLFIVTEAIAVGLDRPGWVFPVLMLPYLVPAIVLSDEASPLMLAPACLGYLIVLGTAVYNRAVDGAEPAGRRGLARGIVASGLIVGVLSWVLTGLASAVIPERGAAYFDPAGIDPSVQLGDPTLDLIRNLRSPSGRHIISYRSSDGQGHYLRLAALSAFDASGFKLVPTDLMAGPLGLPTGIASRPLIDVEVTVADFGSEWLPVPWVPQAVSAEGEWRHDPATRSIVAVGDNRRVATRFLEYAVQSWQLEPGSEEISAAQAGDPGDAGLTLQLPDELDPAVLDLAAELTAGASTDGDKLLTLLSWLRSDAFTYSTATIQGSTMATVSDFLLSSRSGYCEQFAGSLAILARAAGIPSRVVIGFLPGVATEDGFEVTTKDMHAWTEVFLDPLGWVAFDPTPSGAPGAAPVPTPNASASPTPSASTPASATPQPSPSATSTAPAPEAGGGAGVLPGWVAGVAGAALLAAVPSGLRQGRRWARLRPLGDPAVDAENAWDEVRDTALDLGRSWPDGTPRQVAAEVAGWLDPAAAAAIVELGHRVELARFAPTAGADVADGPPPAAQARLISSALAATRPERSALNRVFPRSLLRLPR